MAYVIPAMRLAQHQAQPSRLIARKTVAPAAIAASTAISTTKASSTPPPTTTTTETRDPAADFRALFTSHTSSTPAAAPTVQVAKMAPTAQEMFGPNPWMSNPGGVAPNGVPYSYNPYYFATQDTAAKVAQMVGGKAVAYSAITPYGPFQQNMPNYMVQMPDGREINAGVFASIFDHGYTAEFANRLVQTEITGNPA